MEQKLWIVAGVLGLMLACTPDETGFGERPDEMGTPASDPEYNDLPDNETDEADMDTGSSDDSDGSSEPPESDTETITLWAVPSAGLSTEVSGEVYVVGIDGTPEEGATIAVDNGPQTSASFNGEGELTATVSGIVGASIEVTVSGNTVPVVVPDVIDLVTSYVGVPSLDGASVTLDGASFELLSPPYVAFVPGGGDVVYLPGSSDTAVLDLSGGQELCVFGLNGTSVGSGAYCVTLP